MGQVGVKIFCSFLVIPEVIAWLEEMQAMVTVWAGILSEKPAPKAAWNHKKPKMKAPAQQRSSYKQLRWLWLFHSSRGRTKKDTAYY